jgi:hypothetical protein
MVRPLLAVSLLASCFWRDASRIYNGDTAGIRTTDRGTATIDNCTIFWYDRTGSL